MTAQPSTSSSAVAALSALGVGALAAAPILPSAEAVVQAGGGAALAGGSAVGVLRMRGIRRTRLVQSAVAALSPLVGPADQVRVRATRWRGGFVGAPSRLVINYSAAARTLDPAWESTVAATASARLGVQLRVEGHDQRHRRLRLGRVPGTATDAADPQRARVERTVLKLLGPTARVVDVQCHDGQVARIVAAHEDAPRFATSGHRVRIERTLTEVMPGRWRGVWQLEKDTVTFEVRPSLPDSLWMPETSVQDPEELLRSYRRVQIPIAADEDGRELVWRPSIVPQALVVGGTGSGKTSLSHAIVAAFSRYGWPIWISDAKRVEFLFFRDWPNVQVVATTLPQQVAMTYRVLQLMEHRYEMVERGEARVEDFQPLLVVLDEFTEMRDELLEWYPTVKPKKGGEAKPPTLRQVSRVVRKARTVRIHILLLTQRPDAAFLTGEALALDTPIPTPEGWTTMGEIRAGDIVYDRTGAPTVVTTATEVAYGRPCYRVTFSDGSTFVTDANHRWLAHSARRRAGLGSTYVPLTRAERWPHHAALAEQLDGLDLDVSREVTVAEFESALGPGRNALLRSLLTPARSQVAAAGVRPGRPPGRFAARTYLAEDLKQALIEEIESRPRTGRPTGGEVVTTAQMAQSLTSAGGAANWSIDVAGPIQAPEAGLPLDPWLLGYWLGDGHKAGASIATNDEEVLDRIRALGYRVTHYGRFNYGIATGTHGGRSARPTMVGALRGLGLLHNKHIPPSYLRASIAQREALLAGLLDADGTSAVRGRHRVSGQVVFTNVDPVLVEGVAQLAASLGFIPTVRQLRPAGVESHPSSVAYGRPTRASFAVSFTPDRQVFSLARKRAVLEPSLRARRRPTTSRRYVVKIEPVESVPVRCIAVAADDHLYLAGERFIPTHNTRDNLGLRVSLGRLSPNGALMMWENAATGVTLPRDKTGRCVAVGPDGRPVEAQAYRFPDVDALPGSEEHALRERLRPEQAQHERLLFVPVAEALAAGEDPAREPDFWDYAKVPLVRAADRPDIDPLRATRADQLDPAVLGSPSVLLTLADGAGTPPGSNGVDGVSFLEGAGGDPEDQYHEAEVVDAEELAAGDLLLVDDEQDHWGVVEIPPDVDELDPEQLAVFWRDFDGEEGVVSIGVADLVSRRRPILDSAAGSSLLDGDDLD